MPATPRRVTIGTRRAPPVGAWVAGRRESQSTTATQQARRYLSYMKFSVILTSAAFLLAACQKGATAPGIAPPSRQSPSLPAPDVSTWAVYQNDQYGLTLRYPPDYAIVPPGDQPQPPPTFRVWFQEAALKDSPVASRLPPQFAVDVYENASRQSLDGWLAAMPNVTRFSRDRATVGEVEGVRLTNQALVAPNVFYYVARGPFVYRFTPLGAFSDQMLATVSFIP